MSLLATETQNKVSTCRSALQAVERHLEPLLAKNPNEVARKLAPLEQAELQVGLGYTVASLYFCHLLTQGIDPAEHPIKQELDRIQLYFRKLKTTKEEIDNREREEEKKRRDAEAAQRMMQQYAAAAEATEQRRQSSSASGADAAAAASTVVAAAAAAAESSAQAQHTEAPVAAATNESSPAEVSGAASEEPSTAKSPAKKKRKVVKAGVPASVTPVTALGAHVSEPRLLPMGPSAHSEEAKAVAASLVAKGKAAAAVRKKRKAERREAARTATEPVGEEEA
jgi:exosome complex protein LRP1